MLQMFLESLLLGALLTALFHGMTYTLRRVASDRRYHLPSGQELRCVRPVDLGDH